MTLTFLNVGQGDSLILEWIFKEKKRIALIDCAQINDIIPTIEYLDEVKPKEISFIILSHPHTDHFSGFNKLLDYLTKNNIPIIQFLYTGTISPNRLKIAVKGVDFSNELSSFYSQIYTLKKTRNLKVLALSEMMAPVALNGDWQMMVYSPSTTENDRYASKVDFDILSKDSEEDFQNETHANLLSTFIVLFTETTYIILTADSEQSVFYRLDKDNDFKELVKGKRLILAQMPHHGSFKNYKSIFWKAKKDKNIYTPAVISVGQNKYKHPSKEVLEDLAKLSYSVETTEPLTNFSIIVSQSKLYLDMISIAKIKSRGLKYELDNKGAKKMFFN